MKPTRRPVGGLKKTRHKKRKKRAGEKAKSKVKTSVLLLNPKTILKFAFCPCPNFARQYFASGSESRKGLVYDL